MNHTITVNATMKPTEIIINNELDFLKYFKSKFTLIHMSNVFFRDLHYGVMSYLKDHGVKAGYGEAESTTREVSADLEQKGIFLKIDHQSWKLNFPEFALPRVVKATPTAPAAPATAEKKSV